MVKPKASSTPKFVDISGRRPIGGKNNESVQSPIPSLRNRSETSANNRTFESMSQRTFESKSQSNENDNSDEDVDSNDETDNSCEEKVTNTAFCNCVNPSCLLIGLLVMILLLFLQIYVSSEEQNKVTTLSVKSLSKEFPSQVEDFWVYIKEGIEDIRTFHKPKTFIFLYNDESATTLEKILKTVTNFVTCVLSNCSALPVIVEADDLSNNNFKDYGEIISKHKAKLENSGIMIVKNLENVPGVSAQAFHSFCDEFNPVVEKALFIFTMKVPRYTENNIKLVEKYLYDHWKDIKEDHFHALFTRIVNVVLPIMPEK